VFFRVILINFNLFRLNIARALVFTKTILLFILISKHLSLFIPLLYSKALIIRLII
jgi:hypothetical protein